MRSLSNIISGFNADFIAIGISAVIISTCSLLLYSDFTKKIEISGATEMGIITFKKRVAQRKYANQVIWEDIEQNVSVYNNDSIRTAEMSEAVIHLNDGTDIQLADSSMIIIAASKDAININFSHGTVYAKRGTITSQDVKEVNIVSKDAKISIEKSDIKLSKEGDKELDLTVSKGTAKIQTGDIEKTVEKDQRAVFTEGAKEAKIYKLNLKLLSPAPNKFYISPGRSTAVSFQWEPVKNVDQVLFELSGSKSFGGATRKAVNSNSTSQYLTSGDFYWRLRAKNKSTGKDEFSETRRLIVINDNPVNPIYPNNGASFTYSTKTPIINFKWMKNNIATGYILEIAGNSSFTSSVKTINTPLTDISLDTLNEGTHYWRVRTKVDFIQEAYSSVSPAYMFTIEKKKTIPPPQLISPPDNNRISALMLKNKGLIFSWKSEEQSNKYMISVSSDKNFSNTVFSAVTRSNFVTIAKSLGEGPYYWRVSNIEEAPVLSGSRKFTVVTTEKIKLIAPANMSAFEIKDEEKYSTVNFSWSKSDIQGGYILELSKNSNFIPLYERRILGNTSAAISKIIPGRYFWRVKLLDENKNMIMLTDANTLDINKTIKIEDIEPAKVESKPVEDLPKKETLLVITSPIKGSEIFVDSKLLGQTRVAFKTEPGKSHNIKVSARGYYNYIRNIKLNEGETKEINAYLKKIKQTADINWTENLNAPVISKPIEHKDTMILSSNDGNIIGVNKSGRRIWKTNIKSSSEATPAISASVLYTVTVDSYLHAIDLNSGKTLWKIKTEGPILFGSKPLVKEEKIIIATTTGVVHAFSKNGKEVWRTKLDGGVYNSPSYRDGMIFIGTNSYKIYALKASNGDEIWVFNVDSRMVSASPRVHENTLFIGCFSGSFYAISVKEGELKWKFKVEQPILSSPVFMGEKVYFGSLDGYLYALDAAKGSVVWKYDTDDKITTDPLLSQNVLYVGSGRTIFALDPISGSLKWKRRLEARIKTSASASGNSLYIGLDNGKVVSLQL